MKDLQGRGIERARIYLKKVAKMSFPDTTPEWTTVKHLHEFRNAIVHADGFVAPERELIAWSSSIDGLTVSATGEISLSRGFSRTALVAYRAFLEKLDVACEPLGLWRSVFPIEDATSQ